MIESVSYEKIEELLRKVIREELEELLIDKEINPKYVEKIKKIREEPYMVFNSVEELDNEIDEYTPSAKELKEIEEAKKSGVCNKEETLYVEKLLSSQ